MKKLLFALCIIATLSSCNERPNSNYSTGQVVVNEPTVSVTPTVSNLGANLDLQALGELVKNSATPQDIENKLNTTGSINNLDLNNDGNVDYIKVTEYGDGNTKGFSFTVDLNNNETQEIATIEVNKGAANAQMNIQGNQNLYGNNGYYQSQYSLSDLMFMHYLYSYHSPYYSPYHYGYYPTYYRSYRSTPYSAYHSRMVTTTKTSTITRTTRPTTSTSSIKSPNATKSSNTVTARAKYLAAPTRSQKSFSTTSSANSRPSTSGFKSSSSSTTRSSSPSKSSGWFSSGSSSRSSSSSSSRSSGFGSSSRSSSHSSGGRRSDVRFKKDIQPLKNSLDNILKLKGVSYDWRINEFPDEHFDNVRQNGLLAQDVEKVFPNVVATRPDGYKTVDYTMLIPSLIESIKELKDLNDKQAKEIKDLKDDLKDEANKREKLVKGLNSL